MFAGLGQYRLVMVAIFDLGLKLVRSIFKIFFKAAIVGVALIFLCLSLFFVRLSQGSLEVNFVAPWIIKAIGKDINATVDASSILLSWKSIRDNPEIDIADLTISNMDGLILGSLSQLSVTISLQSILDGGISLKSIKLIQPQIILKILGENKFDLSLVSETVYEGQKLSLSEKLDGDLRTEIIPAVKDTFNPHIFKFLKSNSSNFENQYFESLDIEDSYIIVIDNHSRMEFKSAFASIERDGMDFAIAAQASAEYGGSLAMKGSYYVDPQLLDITGTFENYKLHNMSTMNARFALSEDLDLDLAVKGTFDAKLKMVDSQAVIEKIGLSVDSGSGRVFIPYKVFNSYTVHNIEMDVALYQPNEIRLNKLKVFIGPEGPIINFSGKGFLQEKSQSSFKGTIAIDKVQVNSIAEYWPRRMMPRTRKWIKNNLEGGVVEGAEFAINMSGGSMDDVKISKFYGRGMLSDVSSKYIDGMPPITGIFGNIFFSPEEIIINASAGTVITDAMKGGVSVLQGLVRLHGLDTNRRLADISVDCKAVLSDALMLIDSKPLEYAAALGINPDHFTGQTSINLNLDFPLTKALKLSDVKIQADVFVKDGELKNLASGLSITDGVFQFRIDNDGLDLSGNGKVSGVEAGMTWRENFSDGYFKSQYAITSILEYSQIGEFGLIDFYRASKPYIDGELKVEAIYTLGENIQDTVIVEADLTKMFMRMPILNWQKEANIPSLLSGEFLVQENKLTKIRQFQITSKERNLQVNGDFDFSKGNQLRSLSLDFSAIGFSKFYLDAIYASDKVYDISMDASFLDGRSLLRSFSDSRTAVDQFSIESSKLNVPFRFDAQLGTVQLSQNGLMQNVAVSLYHSNDQLKRAAIKADLTNGEKFSFGISPSDDVRDFTMKSSDSGAMLRDFGLADGLVGGKFLMAGSISDAGKMSSTITIDNFKLNDAPLLARLLSIASLTGIVDELQGDGISFSKLRLPVLLDNNTLLISDGAMYGPSLGLTLEGEYNLKTNILDGGGTIVPAYAFNSALGSLPVIGPLFTGGNKSGGIFAAPFSITGNPDGAEITVNPFATFTPGVFRELFNLIVPLSKPSNISSF